MSTPDPTSKRPWIIGTCVATAFAAILIVQSLPKNDQSDGTPAPSPMATVEIVAPSSSPAPTDAAQRQAAKAPLPDSSALPPGVSQAEIDEMSQVAANFVEQYSGVNWTDKSPTEWLTRVKSSTTPAYQAILAEQYRGAGPDAAWTRFRAAKSEQFAEIQSVRVGVGSGYTRGKVKMAVAYSTAVTSTESLGTRRLAGYNRFVTIERTKQGWKVSGMSAISGGGA